MDYQVLLKVSALSLPTLLSVIEGTRGIALIEIKMDKEEAATISKTARYVNGKRNKGISARDLILETLADKPVKKTAIEDAFEKRGFSRKSASPALSALVREKLIIDNGSDELYRLTKK